MYVEKQQRKVISLLQWSWNSTFEEGLTVTQHRTHSLHKVNVKCSLLALYLCPQVVEGTFSTCTQQLRGRAMLLRWQQGVYFQPVSAFVTCGSGSTCTALTGWEHWRWFNISINNPNMFISYCHVLSEDPSESTWRLHYRASRCVTLSLLSITQCPQGQMKVSPARI